MTSKNLMPLIFAKLNRPIIWIKMKSIWIKLQNLKYKCYQWMKFASLKKILLNMKTLISYSPLKNKKILKLLSIPLPNSYQEIENCLSKTSKSSTCLKRSINFIRRILNSDKFEKKNSWSNEIFMSGAKRSFPNEMKQSWNPLPWTVSTA